MNKEKLHQYIIREAAGFDINIEKSTVDNDNFRKVLFTTDNMQLVVMSIQTEIGAETHDDIDQFIRVEAGKGKATIGNRTFPIQSETAFIIPRGMRHNVVNTGKEPLKLYTVYTPSNHAPGTIQKTKEEADQAELQEAGFEKNPRGWDQNSIKKYTATFTKKMKGGAKAEGFFDKCVEKVKDKMDNPEGFCASLKDEAYGSTGWRGKDKSKAEVSQDVKKAKFKVEADDALNDYLDFLNEGKSAIINDGAPIPNDLIKMLEYDNQPNWIGYCIREYEGRPPLQCKCLQAVKEYAAANPFYQYRIDRYIDVIQQNWDGASEVPYPTQNPDEREINLGTSGRVEMGYTNHDELEPGFLEYAKGLNENFFDKIQKQYEKDKAICIKQHPPRDEKDKTYKKAVVDCIRKRKAAWINSMKFNETGMVTRIPSCGLDQDTTDEDMQSDDGDLQEKMGMKSRIPSAGLKDDVEEGQSEANKAKTVKRDISEFGPALGMAMGFAAEKIRRDRKHKKCKEKYPNNSKKVQDCMKKGI